MEIKKIDIQTKNKKHVTDIAMLVDKPEFLREIQRLREKWQITTLYSPSNFYGFLDLREVQERLSEFNKDIDQILKKFNRDKNYQRVIEYVLVTGVIAENIYQSCYFDVVTIGEKNNLSNPERYQYAIVLSPRTELKEVKQSYIEFKEYVKRKINFQSYDLNIEIPTDRELIEQYHRGDIYALADIDKFRTKPDIETIRDWYWIRNRKYFNDGSKKPLSYPQVLNEWLNLCPLYKNGSDHDKNDLKCPQCTFGETGKNKKGTRNNIEQALATYDKLLKSS